MGCGAKCLKVVLIILNVIFFLAGAAVLGAGLWVRFDSTLERFKGADTGLDEFKSFLYTSAYVLIAFGAFTFVVGFCGCCGAMRESKCLLGTYILLVVLVLGAEIGGGVYAYVKKDTLITDFTTKAKDYLKNKYEAKDNEVDGGITALMQAMECCGVDGAADFNNSRVKNINQSIPEACCTIKDLTAGTFEVKDLRKCQDDAEADITKSTEYFHATGCKTKVESFINKNSVVLLAVAAGVAGFELLVVIMAIGLCCSIEEK